MTLRFFFYIVMTLLLTISFYHAPFHLSNWPSVCRDAPWCIRLSLWPNSLIIGCTGVHPYKRGAIMYITTFLWSNEIQELYNSVEMERIAEIKL